jgi:cytochrome c peroxidase
MSLNVLRASLRSANPVVRRAVGKAAPRTVAFRALPKARHYSTGPEQGSKSNTGLFAGLGALGAAGVAYYFFSGETENAVKSGIQQAKVATNFTPTKEDYQKVSVLALCRYRARFDWVVQVYNRIAELVADAGEYDGASSFFLLGD